jgi:D-amino-acid dehydrogenase
MKIAVIGAGIIGVTTAFELGRDGHAVTVLERRGAAAEEASFANAGLIGPGLIRPWAAPGMPGQWLSQLLRKHAGMRLALPMGLSEMAWLWRWYRACSPDAYRANRGRLQALAFYSRQHLHAVSDQLRLVFDRSDGALVLLRSDRDRTLAEPGLQLLRDTGTKFALIDAEQARRLEPGMNPDTRLAGAIQLPEDEVANCRQFALLLRNEAQRLGVQFRFNATVTAIRTGAGLSVALEGEPQAESFDAVVLCAGTASAALLKPLGPRLPLAAVHGYSVSAAIREPLNAPRSAVMDEHFQVAIARLGQRVRVAGIAELGGHPQHKRAASIRTLYQVLQDWFPGAASLARGVQEWKGARPMFPDGPPVVGPSGVPGLWLNVGHGASGWALASGASRALADMVLGHAPELDMSGFALDRVAG